MVTRIDHKPVVRTCAARVLACGAAMALMFGAVSAASAATHCLNPGSSPSVFSRLLDWQNDSSGTTTTLKLEQGTYYFSVIVDYRLGSTGDLVIEGGYMPGHGCSDAYRSKDASTTTFDGSGANGTFSIAFETNVKVAVLTFANYKSVSGVFLGSVNSPGDLVVDHVIAHDDSLFDLRGGSSLTVKDVLVYSQPTGFAEAIGIATESGAVSATNLTVTDNKSGGLRLGDIVNDNLVEVFNAIVWNNAGIGVFAGYDHPSPDTQPVVYSSIVDSFDAEVAHIFVLPSNTDPLFVDSATHDYHLKIAGNTVSPAVNAGTSAVVNGLPATDIEGNARVIGGAPDMGAYEMNTPYYSTYLVTTTADNGSDASPTVNSLRWALKNARADAQSQLSGPPRKMQVVFDLACPSMLALNTSNPLTAIDYDVTIDATTNPGWSPATGNPAFNATLCVGINGNNLVASAFHVIAGGRATIKGMRFGGFTDAAIRIDDSSGSLIDGNQIGGVATSIFALNHSNHDGVRISGTASGNFVGGFDDISTMNQISDNTDVGVYIDSAPAAGAAPNYVVNNVIGLSSDGQSKFANGNGVYMYNSPNNVVEYNFIGGSTAAGITLSGSATKGTRVQYNALGLAWTGNMDVSNGTYAVLLSAGATNNTIGSDLSGNGGGNTILSDGTGVYVSPSGGTGNRILTNSIQNASGLAIDLDAAGPTANDAFDVDTGPNLVQNYPVVFAAHRTAKYVWIEGSLNSSAYGTFRLDFYWMCCAGASGRGVPDLYLGNGTTGTDGTGLSKHFWVRVPSPALTYPEIALGAISATATDAAGNTSEVGIVGTEDTDLIFRDDFAQH